MKNYFRGSSTEMSLRNIGLSSDIVMSAGEENVKCSATALSGNGVLWERMARVSNPGRVKRYCFLENLQIFSWARSSSNSVRTGDSVLEGARFKAVRASE